MEDHRGRRNDGGVRLWWRRRGEGGCGGGGRGVVGKGAGE